MTAPLRLDRLGFGAAGLGNLLGVVSEEEAQATLQAAWDAGIRHFDTAPHYGLGLSERRLGAFLADMPREEYILTTKVGRLLVPRPGWAGELDLAESYHVPADQQREWDFSASGVDRSLDSSLERLGLDRVDAVYLHDPERTEDPDILRTAVPAVAALREGGRVSAVGIGSMTAATIAAAIHTGALDLAMVAGRLTLLDHSAEREVIPAAQRHGVSLVIASVYNSGLLARARPEPNARFDYAPVPEELFATALRIADVCDAHGVSLPEAALAYPRRWSVVSTIVLGGARPDQVWENARRDAVVVPEALWEELELEGLIPAHS